MIDADRDFFVVEMRVINLKDWDAFWVSHLKRSTDKLEDVGNHVRDEGNEVSVGTEKTQGRLDSFLQTFANH